MQQGTGLEKLGIIRVGCGRDVKPSVAARQTLMAGGALVEGQIVHGEPLHAVMIHALVAVGGDVLHLRDTVSAAQKHGRRMGKDG